MSVGKRSTKTEPLTEHDVAERFSRALLRVWRITCLLDDDADLRNEVLASRFLVVQPHQVIEALGHLVDKPEPAPQEPEPEPAPQEPEEPKQLDDNVRSQRPSLRGAIREVLGRSERPVTAYEIWLALDPAPRPTARRSGRDQLSRALKDLVRAGEVTVMTSDGTRAAGRHPEYVFCKTTRLVAPPPEPDPPAYTAMPEPEPAPEPEPDDDAAERSTWSREPWNPPPFTDEQLRAMDDENVKVTAHQVRMMCDSGIPVSVPFICTPDVLGLYGVPMGDAEACIRKPQWTEIRPESFDKKYPIIGFHRGDMTVIMGFRFLRKPAAMAIYIGSMLEHDTHRTPERTGGGGSKSKAFVPKTTPALIKVLKASGATAAPDVHSTSGAYVVTFRGQVLGRITDKMNRAQVDSDYNRLRRKMQAITRQQEAAG